MGFFKWRGRDQTTSDQPDSNFQEAPETEASPSSPPLPTPEEAADEAVGEAAPEPEALEPVPGPGSPDPEPDSSPDSDDPGRQYVSPPTGDEESAAVNSIENQLLAMVSQLVQPPNASSGLESDHASHLDLPQQADDYPQAKTQDQAESASSSSSGGRSASSPLGAGLMTAASQGGLADLADPPDDEELGALRRLLLGREIDGLEALHGHLNNPERLAQALSQVITEAIRLRVRQDSELVGVLKPTVDNIVRNSVRNNPSELADNLFPVMGPAIRRSISESIRGMLQDFSRTLEKSFSLTGLKWRLESMRTGMKFSEVVMLKTLEYQVEQVLVIHAETGTNLLHLVNENAKEEVKEEVKDPDQVAAMLTAIQQFVNDSFAKGELSTLEFGDRNIYVARAPQVYVACVVLGQAPPNLRIDLQTALELLVMECADELDNFHDNTAPFYRARHHFEGLLISRFKDENQKLPFRAKLLPAFLLLVILAPLGFWGYRHQQMTEMERLIRAATDIPGLKLLQVNPELFGRWNITCLKDNLAEFPEKSLEAVGLPRDRYRIEYLPYVSDDHEIVEKRIKMALIDQPAGLEYKFNLVNNSLTLGGSAPISWLLSTYERLLAIPGLGRVYINDLRDPQTGVTARLNGQDILHLEGRVPINWLLWMYERMSSVPSLATVDISGLRDSRNGVTAYLDNQGVLHLSGQASLGWRESVREQALRVPGISGVNFDKVVDDPDSAEIKRLVSEIDNTVILFQLNTDQPVPGDEAKLRQAAKKLVRLEELANGMELAVSLTIYGHADPTGTSKRNYELSQERAKTLAALLYSERSSIPISTYGLGSDFAVATTGEGETREQKMAAEQASRKVELRVQLSRKVGSMDL